MLLKFPRARYSRAKAWHLILRKPPKLTFQDRVFIAYPHHFRKHHDGENWGWFVQRWEEQHPSPTEETPPSSGCPENFEMSNQTFIYVWSFWIDYKGQQKQGFSAVWYPLHIQNILTPQFSIPEIE